MAVNNDRPRTPSTNGNPLPDRKGFVNRIAGAIFPERSAIPKLTSDGWRAVLMRIIDKLPRWGLVFLIWTALAGAFAWLMIREIK